MIELPRRRFLAGITAVICAPAIVRAASLMPVKAYRKPFTEAEFREILRRAFLAKEQAMKSAMENAILHGTGIVEVPVPGYRTLTVQYKPPQAFFNNSLQSSFQQPMVLR